MTSTAERVAVDRHRADRHVGRPGRGARRVRRLGLGRGCGDPGARRGPHRRSGRRPSWKPRSRDADIVIVCTPVPAIPDLVARALAAAPEAVVTDAGSIKDHVVREVASLSGAAAGRFVGGHPMGGSERSGPEHASASVVDGIVWVLTPTEGSEAERWPRSRTWIVRIGGRPVQMSPARHDRLVAFVSHLPQVASTALMGLAATEEADEPDILLAGRGRVPRPHPAGLVQPGPVERDPAVEPRGDRRGDRPLRGPAGGPARDGGRGARRATWSERSTKRSAPGSAWRPSRRCAAGVAVLQVQVPDRPGALAELTSVLAEHAVNIEDLQIVHSPEGGRGTVHLTVAATSVERRAHGARVPVLRPDPAGLRCTTCASA